MQSGYRVTAGGTNNYPQMIITLRAECRGWRGGMADLEIRWMIDSQAEVDDATMYTRGLVMRVRD